MHDDDRAIAAHTTPYLTRSASRSPLRTHSSKTMRLNSNHEKSRNPWSGHRWPATSSSLVCSRDVPVFRHRSVLCPLGILTHAIIQTVLRCCPQSELVSHRIRTNAQFSTTKLGLSFNGSRSLTISFNCAVMFLSVYKSNGTCTGKGLDCTCTQRS